jgi:PKD repeat protein
LGAIRRHPSSVCDSIRVESSNTLTLSSVSGIHILDDDPSIAEIKVDNENYPVGSTVHFSCLQSYDIKTKNLRNCWFFGDGSESVEAKPVHMDAEGGHYKVTLIVTDSARQSQQQTKTLAQ